MPQRHIRLEPRDATTTHEVGQALRARFEAVRAELHVEPGHPPEALAEAEAAAAVPHDLPERDETGVPLFTVDPPGSTDLDQAMCLERDGDGYRVRYAIADLTCFVRPGGPLDAAVRSRGQTIYCPDLRVGLHPTVLSEGAASLLPGQTRPAYVWDLRLDGAGEVAASELARAMVRSVERLDYAHVQDEVDRGSDDERFVLLREIGERRLALERARGGASLPMPEQEVHEQPDGTFTLTFRPPRASEDWNAQISLMTGMVAAEMMLSARVGILRTMPAPEERSIERFRRQTRALGATWSAGQPYGELIRSLDRTNPRHLALIHEATTLLRGAGYTPFDGEAPPARIHAAVAAPYAHVTAPLRRLVDRFGLAVCEAVSQGREVPEWARAALPELPELMTASDRQARSVDRACADAVEAAVLVAEVGHELAAVVVDEDERGKGVVVQLRDLPVLAPASGRGRLGDDVRVRCTSADVAAGRVGFELA